MEVERVYRQLYHSYRATASNSSESEVIKEYTSNHCALRAELKTFWSALKMCAPVRDNIIRGILERCPNVSIYG